jgi:hypothetical protein
MKEIFIFVAMLIVKSVPTGQPRTIAIFIRNLYNLRILFFGLVEHFQKIGPYSFEDEAVEQSR